jgi:hypothetical protein
MQEEMIWERTMEFADGRANDWEEDMTNGWFEFAGAATAVAAALNGEDSEELDNDDDSAERRWKRKVEETSRETSSESDDDSEDDQKPLPRKLRVGPEVSEMPSCTRAWDCQSYVSVSAVTVDHATVAPCRAFDIASSSLWTS